jgi:hypothetical protein
LGGAFACRTGDSALKADDEFRGEKVGYWYEVLSFEEGAKYNFVDYHRNNKSALLGNGAGPLLPDQLKGLWFMDGNPLGDKSIQMSRVYPSTSGNDFILKVYEPTNFSWSNIPRSHSLNQGAQRFSFEYEFKWADCPADVKRERETMWGMANGACTKADRQFATITPYVKVGLLRAPVPQSALYFDMYLRPKQGNSLIWERRSRLLAPVREFADAFAQRDGTDWHRYQLVQILDKDGNVLQGYPRFVEHLKSFAAEHSVELDRLLFYKCFEGKTGCDAESLAEGVIHPEFEGENGAQRFGTLPFF